MINILQWNILDYELAEQDYFVKSSLKDLDWKNRLPKIQNIIEYYNPNLICLQEVQNNIEIKEILGQNFDVIFMQKKSDNKPHGNLIAFKKDQFVLQKTNKIQFKENNGKEMSQNFIHVQLLFKSDNKIVNLITTHLKSKKSNSDIRLNQTQQIVEYILQKNMQNIIIAGDLNADEDEPCHSIIQNKLHLQYAGKGVFTTIKYTKTHKDMLQRKIDYIYYNPENFELIEEKYLNETNQNKACPNSYLPSDHLPTNVILKQL